MNNINNDKPSMQKNYNSSTSDERMGFAKRDRLVTDTIAQPMVINSLGRDVAGTLARYNVNPPADSALANVYGKWSMQEHCFTTPGIWVYDFERIFALRDQYLDAQTADIFDNKWEDIRLFNNSIARNIQPGDIQALSSIAMEIKCHIANIRRILNIMFKVVNHQLNSYYSGENLVTALGFRMTEKDMRMHVVNWWQQYTLNIVHKLNAIRWFSDDFIPGCNRWAGLCREVYKDTPVYTDYCQVYMFRPYKLWKLRSAWDAEHHVYQWTFSKVGYDDKAYGSDHYDDGVFAFEQYLGMVSDLIHETFYDDSAMDIVALLNTIAERAPSSDVHTDYFNIPDLPFGGEDVPLTYDFQMQMAVHNMTIISTFKADPPTIDPSTGRMQQFCDYGTIASYNAGSLLAGLPKVIDLPWFGATVDDMINATQWTVGTHYDYNTVASNVPVHPGDVGTDVIVSSTIWTNDYEQNADEYRLFSTFIGSNAQFFYYSWEDPTAAGSLQPSDVVNYWQRYALMAAFENCPMTYITNCPIDWEGNKEAHIDGQHRMGRVVGNTEILYVGDGNTLSQIHKQFTRNFWGYPVRATDSGQFVPRSDPKQ